MRSILALAVLVFLPAIALANGYETYPPPLVWSPDSTLLASVEANAWPYDESGLVAGTLRVYGADGAPRAELLSGDSVGSPAFNPDSAMLICVFSGKIAVFKAPFETATVSLISAAAPVLDCTFEYGLHSFENPSNILASCGERFYGANIWRIGIDGSKLEQLTHVTSGASAVAPLSLTYGSFLYLEQRSDDPAATYERLWHWNSGVKETEAIQYTAPQDKSKWLDDYHESNPVVLGAKNFEVIFQRGGWGDWTLIRQGEDGNEHVELPDAEEPSVSFDGRYLAFVRRPAYAKAQTEYAGNVVPQVWIADRQCHQLWHVETSIAGGEFPAVSPDGAHLAWIEFNGGKVQTVVRDIAPIVAGEASGTY